MRGRNRVQNYQPCNDVDLFPRRRLGPFEHQGKTNIVAVINFGLGGDCPTSRPQEQASGRAIHREQPSHANHRPDYGRNIALAIQELADVEEIPSLESLSPIVAAIDSPRP